MDTGLLIIRLAAGLVMAAHGSQKLLGWFGGYGIAGTGAHFERIGFRPGRPFAAAAAAGETFGGVLMALGFLGPVGPAAVLSVMIVAALAVHWQNGFFVTTNGIEVPFLYAAVSVGLALTGAGRYSIDAWLGLASNWTPALTLSALAVAVAGGLVSLKMRSALPAAAV